MHGSRRAATAVVALALGLATTAAVGTAPPAVAGPVSPTAGTQVVGRPSGVTARLAAWVAASGDNDALPYMIVDKPAAHAWLFDADGAPLADAPVLLGLALGDDSAPGVGDLALASIPPGQRTTPAGRFVAHFGPSDHGTVLWVDDADGVSLHPVITTNPAEHRLERLASARPGEHRISFGCINVPAGFYDDVLVAAFVDGGIVYILPDTRPLADVFPAFAAADRPPTTPPPTH